MHIVTGNLGSGELLMGTLGIKIRKNWLQVVIRGSSSVKVVSCMNR